MCLVVSFAGVNKSYFLDLRIKSYGCLKFLGEVWAGWECTRANEEELITCIKYLGQEVGGGRQGYSKGITCIGVVSDHWLQAADHALISGRLGT
jgi:hypothetical protein